MNVVLPGGAIATSVNTPCAVEGARERVAMSEEESGRHDDEKAGGTRSMSGASAERCDRNADDSDRIKRRNRSTTAFR